MAGDFRLDGVDVGSRLWQLIFDFAEDGVEKNVGDDRRRRRRRERLYII